MKIGFCLPKLSLKCSYKEGVLENVVTGIQMRGKRVQPTEPSGDLVSQLDVGVECGEIMVNEILNVVIFAVVLILKEKKK